MSSSFEILFSVKIQHSYYQGECRDFDIHIPADTAALLRNGRVVARTYQGVFHLLCERKEDGSPIASLSGKTIRLGMILKNAQFSNFTRMDFPPGSIPLYTNFSNPDSLDTGTEIFLTSALFSHPVSRPNRPVTLTLKDAEDKVLHSTVVTDTEDQSPYPVDLRRHTQGSYFITEKYSGTTKKFQYYLDPELLSRNASGILEIRMDDSLYLGSPRNYEIQFSAKEEILKYYVIGKKYTPAEMNTLLVNDVGFTEESRARVQFTRVNQESFTSGDISPSLLADSQSGVVLFKSQNLVSRQEKPRKKIQLTRNTDVIIKHLPQPGTEQSTADMIIQISKP